MTEPEDAELAIFEPDRAREFVLLPAPGAERGRRVRHAPVQAADQRERELRHGARVAPGRRRHVDPALTGEGHVDVLRAGAGSDHEVQGFAGRKRGRRHGGAADDQNVHPAEAGRQLGGREARLVLDLDAQSTHLVQGIFGQAVGNQHAHGGPGSTIVTST